jgi:hypothetical protein
MVDRNEILQRLKEMGLESDTSLVESNIVSNIDNESDHQMFEDFLKILQLHTDDSLAFKLGSLDKRVTFPATVCATCSEHSQIIAESNAEQVKPRYVFMRHFFKNYNIACSATISKTGNKANQFSDISRAFINFMSALEYQKARVPNIDETEDQPSEKLKSGVFKR